MGYTYTKNNYHLPIVLIKLGVLCFYLLNLAIRNRKLGHKGEKNKIKMARDFF